MDIDAHRQLVRIRKLANRCGCRVVTEARSQDGGGNRTGYRLIELARNTVVLGERVGVSLEVIEAHLKMIGIPPKSPTELLENRVRQMAGHRGYVVKKTRPQLYVRTPGTFQLFNLTAAKTAVLVDGQSQPTLDELEAFLLAQPVRHATHSIPQLN